MQRLCSNKLWYEGFSQSQSTPSSFSRVLSELDAEYRDEDVDVEANNNRQDSADAAKDGNVKADDNIGTNSEDGIDKCAKAFTVKQ